ncbi:MAG: DUF3866 family protein [Acidimicrobiales bacterium]
MPTFRTGEVTEILSERVGLQRVAVRIGDDVARAYCLTQLVGDVAVGDTVVCNTTAVELGLGTGGWHVVHWNLSRDELVAPGPDHVMKLRYTSLQFDAGTSELEYPECSTDLRQTPVVVCQVHSQVGVVAATIASLRPGTRVAYVMTDGASLPIVLSDLVDDLRRRDMVTTTVTAGHAFGGDLEAVTVASGIALAVDVALADIVVVGMGPGVVGTGTKLGTTSIEAAGILDAVDALGGVPVLCVRASDGDARDRHTGISHHTLTAIELTRAAPAVAPVPEEIRSVEGVVVCPAETPDVAAILAAADLRITTMGRDVDADPLFFAAAGAAAAVAVSLL